MTAPGVAIGPGVINTALDLPLYFDHEMVTLDFLPTPTKASWIGKSHLASVSSQGDWNTCFAHSLCRLHETVSHAAGNAVSLDPNLFHQCVLGLNCASGVDAQYAANTYIAQGLPRSGNGFTPNAPCPTSMPGMVPPWEPLTITDAATAKHVIARKAPLMAIISAEQAFEDLRDFSIYHDGGGPITLSSHALLIIGFDDEAQCWEVQNSKGVDWGKNGRARIAYGSAGIFQAPVFTIQ